jgi:hypothetical protein
MANEFGSLLNLDVSEKSSEFLYGKYYWPLETLLSPKPTQI